MSSQITIQLIAALCAVACALPGVFLVLRRVAMMSDAISHVVLLGIVCGFFLVWDINSPVLIIGATLSGLLTVFLVEWLAGTGRMKRDAAIGLVFPMLFSIAILLITRYADNIHLDTDSVLLGELAFAPYDHLIFRGHNLGARGLWSIGLLAILNISFLMLFYKELKLATFDPGLAASLGFSPILIHYGLMAVTSFTAVQAFDIAGSILVVALMIVPASSAWLLTDKLSRMLIFSALIGVLGALGGYWFSYFTDTSIAGSMAVILGVVFGGTLVFAPYRGMVAMVMRRRRQKILFAGEMLSVHLLNHENSDNKNIENCIAHLGEHLRWNDSFSMRVVRYMEKSGFITRELGGVLELTQSGRTLARESLLAGR